MSRLREGRANTPGRRPSSRRAWLRSPLSRGERKCRVAMGRWYGAFTDRIYVEAPGDLDIDHLDPHR